MKYLLKDIQDHCAGNGKLWHQIAHNHKMSPDYQFIELPFAIPALREVPQPSTLDPRPSRERWPLWAKALARSRFRQAEDTGLGDTLVHLIGDARSERFKKWFERRFGKDCGCEDRREWLNKRFRY